MAHGLRNAAWRRVDWARTSRSWRAIGDAERDSIVLRNVCSCRTPKIADIEMAIVRDVPSFIDKLRGTRLYSLPW